MREFSTSKEFSKTVVLLLVVLVLSDVLLAQVAKAILHLWDVRNVERMYRVQSPIYHHDLARNQETMGLWGVKRYPMRTNSLGFKDRQVREVPLQANRRRIVLLGDSFTEGIGVAYEETYAGHIAEALKLRNIEVLNAAVSSYSPAIYYRKTKYLLEELGLSFDEVVVFLDLSDIQDEAAFYELDQHEHVIAVGDWPERLISRNQPVSERESFASLLQNNSVLVRFLSLLAERVWAEHPGYGACREMGKEALAAMTNLERSLWTTNDSVFEKYGKVGLEKAQGNMGRLLDLLQRHHKKLTLVVYPWPDQIMQRDLRSKQVEFWKRWAGAHGVPFVNLFPTFIAEDDPEAVIGRYFIPCDMHLNEAGHQRFAQAFFKEWGVGN
jgi:GDSL-like Lipase/Acylhydrolase family